jgi:hypothetical protein
MGALGPGALTSYYKTYADCFEAIAQSDRLHREMPDAGIQPQPRFRMQAD